MACEGPLPAKLGSDETLAELVVPAVLHPIDISKADHWTSMPLGSFLNTDLESPSQERKTTTSSDKCSNQAGQPRASTR